MMTDKFTVEEVNLMCIYCTNDRKRLIGELTAGLNFVGDPEMIELFGNTIEKLELITDAEFAEIGLYAADEDDEKWSVEYSE